MGLKKGQRRAYVHGQDDPMPKINDDNTPEQECQICGRSAEHSTLVTFTVNDAGDSICSLCTGEERAITLRHKMSKH